MSIKPLSFFDFVVNSSHWANAGGGFGGPVMRHETVWFPLITFPKEF